MDTEKILQHTAHRPWPLQSLPWAMQMSWRDLAFFHWPISPHLLRPRIPAGLELDTFEGNAWLGIVPFRMEEVRLRLAPPIPTTHSMGEINVRTYVKTKDRAGVWFFSLDASSLLAVRGARLLRLPYYDAKIETSSTSVNEIEFRSHRTSSGDPEAGFHTLYSSSGPIFHPLPGSLEHWLTERYCLFTAGRNGDLFYLDIHHRPWPLQTATAETRANSMASAAGFVLPETPPLVHFAARQDVLAWPPRRVPALRDSPAAARPIKRYSKLTPAHETP